MKKLLLFVIACTLGLFGTVSAQETITIGDQSQTNYSIPIEVFFPYSISQQSYSKTEIADAGGYAGNITSIAFKTGDEYSAGVRKLRVFMTNTENEVTFDVVGNGYNSLPNLDGLVFEGEVNFVGAAWNTIEFQTPFAYNGNHLLITVADDTGENQNDIYFAVHQKNAYDADNNSISWAANIGLQAPADPTSNISTMPNGVRNQIQLTFSAAGEGGGEEPTPTPEPGDDLASEFSFDFEDGTLTGLRAFAGEGSNAPLWTVGNVANGNYGIYSKSYDADTYTEYPSVNNYVVTEKAYEITAGSKLSWYVYHAYANIASYDMYEVVVSENGEDYQMIWSGCYDGNTAKEISLAEYAGKKLYIGFRHYCTDDYGADAVVLDDIVLTAGEGGETPEPTPEPEVDKCVVIFTLNDQYDGWYNDKLVVSYDGISQDLTFTENAKTKEYVLEIPQGSTVNVLYQRGLAYSFPSEESLVIKYESGKEISSIGTMSNGYEHSFVVDCAPSAPEKPVVEAVATGETTIALTITSAGAESYTIYQGTEVVAEGLTAETYTVEGLTPDTEYCFTVVAVNEVGSSEVSEEACATTYSVGTAFVQIGDETSTIFGYHAPICNQGYYANYSLSQQIYLKEEIGGEPCAVTSVAFQNYYGGPNTRNIIVYMTNINDDKDTFVGGAGDWVTVSSADIVYQGEHTFGANGEWTTIEFETPFIYRGKNVCITVNDLTGVTKEYSGYDAFYVTATENIRGIYATNQTSQFDCSNLTATAILLQNSTYDYNTGSYIYTPYIVNAKIKTEPAEVEALPLPTTPTNLFAESTGISSIALTWEAAEHAATYNVYEGEELVATNLTTTSYAVEGLSDGTEYCFTVTAVNLEGESEASEPACATTETFDGCFVVFTLKDTYGDGWTGNYLTVSYGETTDTLGFSVADFNFKEFSKEYVLPLAIGTNVTVSFVVPYTGTWPSENSFVVSYKDGDEIINVATGTFVDNNVETFTYDTFVVNCAGEEPTPEPVVGNYRLEAINHTQDWNNVSYVYESETSDKVVEIKNGGYSTFLQYDANGVLTGYEYGWVENGAIDKESYSAQFTIVEYTYSGDKLASYKESEYFGWYSTEEPQTETEYTFAYNAEGQVETVEFGDSKIVYTYENGKLASETKSYYDEWAEIPGYKTEYIVEYAYDENGNCTTATQYSAYDGEKIARKATEYNYELTIPAANVTAFAYPHEVAPAHANLITRAISYEFQEDWETGETYTTNYIVQKYVYNPEVLAAPLAPMGLTARAISDTEVELNWTAAEAAESFKIYSGETVVAENITETTYKVTGLTSSTEYCYTVVGVNGGVESPASEPACVTTNDLVAIYPATIEFGTVRVGNYWAAKETTAEVEINRLGKVITSITTDNAVFTVPADLDMTSDYIYFELGYDKATIEAGEYAATLIVTLEGGAIVTAPITATAYAPVTPDVFELAQEITFTEGVYTNTPDSTTLHDDYLMPEEYEWEDGNLLDAVYTFSLEIPAAVKVNVTGEKAQYAIYKAEGFEYPTEETFNGVDRAMTTEFSFDFNDGELGAFTIQDNDEFKDYTWKVEEGALTSYSFNGWYDENNQWVYINDADERIITSEAYNITEKSVLTFDMNVNGNFEGVIVEVTKDGETFIEIENILETSYSWDWLAKRISIGEIFAEKGLEYGEYQISLYHDMPGYGELNIDNLVLAERELAFPEGTYYLFVAAEKDLAVEVTAVETEEVVIVPEPKAYRLEGVESFISTEYTYDELFTNRVVTMVKEGITSTFAYNKAGQLETIVDTSEGEDEEGNPTSDTINIVKYKYNQDGTIATHSEATAGWEPMVTDFVYEGGKLVKTVIADYEMEVTLAYNAEGLLSEKVTSYSGEIDSKEVYTYDAEGRLVDYGYYGYDAWDLLDYYLAEGITYKYDANGNCVSAESYLVFDGEKSYYQTAKYFYDEKIANEDVYTFDLPHVAMTNVAPAQVNVLVKELSYYTEYDDNGEAHNHTYDVTVYSYNPAIEVAPIAPMNLVAEVVDGVVELTWEAFADAETFVVYQDGEAIAENVEVGAYTVEGLEAGEYSFAVQAVNAVGRSMVTEEVEVTIEGSEPIVPEPTVPAAPVVEVVEVTETTIVFAWAPVEGATKYNVYAYGELAGSTPDTIAGFKDLEPNTEYCFTVTAVNEVGESAPSEKVCATTKPDAIAENAAAFNIYPNPVADRLFIETEANVEEVTIYTLTGVMVYSEVDFNNNSINVSELNGGVYIMKVRTENGEAVRRFIKK